MIEDTGILCSDIARKYGMPLVGSATRGDIWFLIEYPGRWEANAFERSEIPEKVKSEINKLKNGKNQARILLLKKPENKGHKGLSFFVCQTSPIAPRLYEFQLEDYEDILGLNLLALAAGLPGDLSNLRRKPLFLVCTNGRRDKCCSMYGPEVYQTIEKAAGEAAWQSSHIGGHNRPPVMLFFPHGVNYGKATPSEAQHLVKQYQDGSVVLSHFRGRVCHEPHIQAAEYFWREQTGILDFSGFLVESALEIGEDEWTVRITSASKDSVDISLKRHQSDFDVPITCSGKKLGPIVHFKLLN